MAIIEYGFENNYYFRRIDVKTGRPQFLINPNTAWLNCYGHSKRITAEDAEKRRGKK
jgi:hypothetical protein